MHLDYPKRSIAFALVACITIAFCLFSWGWRPIESYALWKVLSHIIIGSGCVALWLLFPNHWKTGKQLVILFTLAIVARLFLLGMPVSDDVNRYLWEGKIILAGESPYEAPADDPRYLEYRDEYWELMNHKDRLTAYPPAVELLFAAVAKIYYHPLAYKLVFIGFDLGTLFFLIKLLQLRKLPLRLASLYAFNPVVLFSIAGEAHFDALMLFALISSLYFQQSKRQTHAWVWLGLAIQIKFVAIILIPLYLIHNNWKRSWTLTIPLILPSLYFADSLSGVISGLLHFGGTSSFNGPLHSIVTLLIGNSDLAARVMMVLFALFSLWVIWSIRDPLRAAHYLFAGLVCCSPIVHFWYILWVIPGIVLYPSLSWLVLSITSATYHLTWWQVEQGAGWHLPSWAVLLHWVPFFIVLLYEARFNFMRRLRPWKHWDAPKSISVVIPTLNEGSQIQACLQSLKESNRLPDEVIICDAGSTDDTISHALAQQCTLVPCKKGRGHQIKAGVDHASSEVALILHADCQCPPDALDQILDALTLNPDVVGGAIGQRFNPSSGKMLIIESLNDARATLGGTSFGDQGQFFRTEACRNWGGFPDYPLMEDVELSLRMMRHGRTLLLGNVIQNSARQWQESFLQRILLILRIIIKYRLSRIFKKDATEELYKIYYKN